MCVGLGVSILYALILGFVLFCGYGTYRGHSLREMLSLALSGVRTVKGILLTFLLIGVITALWRRSGTIAFIICRALDLCGERVMLPAAFLLCALISYLTGTAFGTAATMGVICAALAAGAFPPSILAAPSSPVHTLATAALQCPPALCSSARSPARIFTATLAGW